MSKFRFDNMDAAESAFLSRQLENIRPGLFDVKYGQLKAKDLLPFNTNVHPGAKSHTIRFGNRVGAVAPAGDYSTRGPSANVYMQEDSVLIKGFVNSYMYSIDEVRAAQMAGLPLEEKKAVAARMALAEKLDDLLLSGSTNDGVKGLFNQTLANVTEHTIANGEGSGAKPWGGKSPFEILKDMHGAVNTVVEGTLENAKPDTMALPLTSYNYIKALRLGDGMPESVLTAFLRDNGQIKRVIPSSKLETAGASSAKRMVVYQMSPDVLEAIVPIEFEQMAPQQEGFRVITECHMKTAGVFVYFPKELCYADGI